MVLNTFLGIDIGSVSANFALLDEENNILENLYVKTQGNPIKVVQEGLHEIRKNLKRETNVSAVGTTGSGRNMIGAMVGADVIKNEITAHAVAAINVNPIVKTVFEIGGQDSKLIIIRDRIAVDFSMNTICAAGTGAFLEYQCGRLKIPIEDFGSYALQSKNIVRIAGRCTVFAESDMINKQQFGHSKEDIINGLCEALVRNYLSNVCKGKEILEPIFFQGGVAANIGIKSAFERFLNMKLIIPKFYNVMGAIGVAIIAKTYIKKENKKTNFKGFDITNEEFITKSFECKDCSNLCEIVEFLENKRTIAYWGSRCGKWKL
jgi:predicted CoA-substrate-specific enzyme activase